MKWIFAFLLAIAIFGSATLFTYREFVQPEIQVRTELQSPPDPNAIPDISLPEFEAAQKLKAEGKLSEARSALIALIQKYPAGKHAGEAQDLLGDVNISILLSDYPSPDKQEYVVRSGDVLARVAAKMKTTPELIMRTNNLSGTMLRIGQKLYISHSEFSILIQRKSELLYLLDRQQFFKRYHLKEEKLPPKPPAKLETRVAEIMAWKNGKRIGIGSREFLSSTRWIRLGTPVYVIYSLPDESHPILDVPPPALGLGMTASDVEELSSLVNTRTAVTITQ
jgi:LysM repeat protein